MKSTFAKTIAVLTASLIGLFSLSTLTHAQNGDLIHFGRDYTPSAEVYQIDHQGDRTKPDLYTGSMNFSVPVYTYSDPDFTIPVSLDYHYNGFKPGLYSGTVGLGWSLNCGGVITRDVYGLPDEDGYFTAAKTGKISQWNIKTKMPSDVCSENIHFLDLGDCSSLFSSVAMINYNGSHYDCNADIFHISSTCGSPTGDFMMLNNGSFRLINSDIPFGEVAIDTDGGTSYGLEFSVTAPDGTIYEYGGSQATDYVAKDYGQYCTFACKLHTITAPNGRVATFHYSEHVQVNLSQEVFIGLSPSMTPSDTWSYASLLESIDIDGDTVVEFTYTNKAAKEYDESYIFGPANVLRQKTDAESRLSSIIIYNSDGDIVQSATLTHAYSLSGEHCAQKMFLTNVQTLRDGTWKFTYDGGTSQLLPDYRCTNIDHWGFWNSTSCAGQNIAGFLPINSSRYAVFENKNTSIYSTLTGTGRNPSFTQTKKGSLTFIEYPTGGYSDISYGQNTASYLFDRKFGAVGFRLNDFGFQIGGIRVSNITNSDGYSIEDTHYDYHSGTLYDMPRYGAACLYYDIDESWLPSNAVTYGNQCGRALIRDGFIGYSRVVTILPDGSRIETRFNDEEDEWDDNLLEVWANGHYGYVWEEEIPFHLFAPPTEDYQAYRGRIWQETEYNADGDEVSNTTYTYQNDEISNQSRVINLVNCIGWIKCNLHSPILSRTTSTTPQGTIIKEYSYNNLGQRSCETVRDGFNDEVRKTYTSYCHEQNSGEGLSTLNAAVRQTRSTVKRREDGTEAEIESNIFYYGSDTTNIQPVRIATTKDSQTRNIYYEYDANHRPVRIDYPGGRYIENVWDDLARYLTSREENADGNTTHYSWKDLVGLSSVLYPSGLGETYSYDSKCRLSIRRDNLGNKIAGYGYHLKNETASSSGYNWIRTDKYNTFSSYVSDYAYYDGLGYCEQTVSKGASGNGKDIVTPIVYDESRRPDAFEYLPYESSQRDGSYNRNAESNQIIWYNSHYGNDSRSRSFIQRNFEEYAAGRPVSETRPGYEFNHNGKRTIYEYGNNTDEDQVIYFIITSGGEIEAENLVPEGHLKVTKTVDEDGKTTKVFETIQGRKVLERKIGDGDCLDTYFVYDKRDNLVCVLPPKVSAMLESEIDYLPTPIRGNLLNLCFTWSYDAWGNVVQSKTPDIGPTLYEYDSRDRLVRTADAAMLQNGIWKYLEYDALDRIVETGYESATVSHPFHECGYWSTSSSGIPSSPELVFTPDGVATAADLNTNYCHTMLSYENIRECPTVNEIVIHGTRTRQRAYYYDSRGRNIQIKEADSDGWRARYSFKYDYAGNLVQSKEVHTKAGTSVSDSLRIANSYDSRGRLSTQEKWLNGQSLGRTEYYIDALGRVSGRDFVNVDEDICATETWTFDMRGALTAHNATLFQTDENVFSEDLRYYNGDEAEPSYCGYITENHFTQGSGSERFYGYNYDGFGRLDASSHYNSAGQLQLTESESDVTYDPNGNILALTRRGVSPTDVRSYTFNYSGNRLTGYSAPGAGSESLYYDPNGNVNYYSSQCLDLCYNVRNLPCMIYDDDTWLANKYTYLDDGSKLQMTCVDEYDDTQYAYAYQGSFIYRKTGNNGNWTFRSAAWDCGRTVPDGSGYTDLWYVTDYQGNVRSVVKLADGDASDLILEQNDYLPYGTRLTRMSSSSLDNRFRYAGKEEQPCEGDVAPMLDFGARFYDPTICRWLSQDPKAASYTAWSPYNYCAADPVMYVDPDGKFSLETGEVEEGDNIELITRMINERYHINLSVNDIIAINHLDSSGPLIAGSVIQLPGNDVSLLFDLDMLQVIDNTYDVQLPDLSWSATSGRPNFQSKEFQKMKNIGPLPEGEYIVDPARTQYITISDIIVGYLGRGKWPGGKAAWGDRRTWITPTTNTTVFGRGNFSIHGGSTPGSAGCIDLTNNNNSFHSWLSKYNKIVILKVKY